MIDVYDCRSDLEYNVVVRPEFRGRFLKIEPRPAPPQHSHDLAGEVFLVIEGECEFFVGDESVTCSAGQLIYVDKTVKHAMRAIGDQPCTLYMSITPHVEPTHTFYSDDGQRAPVRYDAWRGPRTPDGKGLPGRAERDPRFEDGTLTRQYIDELAKLQALSTQVATLAVETGRALDRAVADGDRVETKAAMDDLWLPLRDLLNRVSSLTVAWNELAPQASSA